MRILACISVLVLLSASASAQTWAFELWHDGRVVLTEGDTIRGQVKYDMQQDLVQVATNQRPAEAFTARKVLFFEIFDNTVNKYRRFFTLPYAVNAGYRTPVFFELLEEGKMTLLAREILEYKTYSSPYFVGSYTRLVLNHKYFFLQDNGEIEEFIGNKNDLLDLMGKRSDAVEKYMKSNNLRFDDKEDIAKIVAYYNSLVGS